MRAGPLNTAPTQSVRVDYASHLEDAPGCVGDPRTQEVAWVVSSEGTVCILREVDPLATETDPLVVGRGINAEREGGTEGGRRPGSPTLPTDAQPAALAPAVVRGAGIAGPSLGVLREAVALQLPERSFTSPVVAGCWALVGCRDNSVYCLAYMPTAGAFT